MIVPTDGRLFELIKKLDLHDDALSEEESVEKFMNEIINSIGTEQEASLNLAVCALEFVGHFIYMEPLEASAKSFANALVGLGEKIVDNLKEHGIYFGGNLRYQYHSRIGDDIVLSRIDIDDRNLADMTEDPNLNTTPWRVEVLPLDQEMKELDVDDPATITENNLP
jgi:hypothetical protein